MRARGAAAANDTDIQYMYCTVVLYNTVKVLSYLVATAVLEGENRFDTTGPVSFVCLRKYVEVSKTWPDRPCHNLATDRATRPCSKTATCGSGCGQGDPAVGGLRVV